ncbi:MAG: hypothetical protein AB4911_08635 [Oscillochloridaceae bacterium umkhey_bin13]
MLTRRSLAELFVDRLLELDRFRRSLAGTSGRRIIRVTGGPGMGKSWLLRAFASEATARQVPNVLLDFSDGQAYDVLTLIRRCRDALGPEHFNPLTVAINEATAPRLVITAPSRTAPGPLVDLSGSQLGDLQLGDVAGGTIIKDNSFVFQSENPLLLQAIEDRLTQVFFACLAPLAATSGALLLFDSYERTSQDHDRWVSNAADRWIQSELLSRVSSGQLPGTLVVLAGRRLPTFDISWNPVVGELVLGQFTLDDVRDYLRENRGLSDLSDAEIQTLFNAVQGNPQLLGIIGDNLEQTRVGREADDDW